MNSMDINEVYRFAQEHIGVFHESRLKCLSDTRLKDLLKKKNPYLFKAKHIITAQDLITALLDARLSSSEEKIFGDFLEDLAIFVAQRTLNAVKSSSRGIDLEYTKDSKRYLVSVKSGLNWGNSSQWQSLKTNFENALRVLRQSYHIDSVDCVLGVCYGKARTTIRRGIIIQVCGQNFWYMISGDESFYTEIVEPIGYKAKERNESFSQRKAELINKFTKQFLDDFCDESGKILWEDLVMFNSQNLTTEDRRRLR